MKEFRNAICDGCSKDFNYLYEGGRPRKYCPTCKPQGYGRRRSLNAYARVRPFPWGHMPSDWFVSRPGNACRTIGPHWITVYPRGNYFWLSFPSMWDEKPRISEIRATGPNVGQALAWAERVSENLFRSFATR